MVSEYISLSKPKIIILLLITGIIGYLIPDIHSCNLVDLFIFCLCGYLSSGGAMVMNSYIDRDIDQLMERTKHRVTLYENDKFSSIRILIIGAFMSAIGTIWGWMYFNQVVGIFLAWGVLFYIFGYTLILKRKTIFNTVFGGFASPSPVWAGYAARLSDSSSIWDMPVEGWLLGLLVVIWTPSHTWALSTKYIEDYRNANIPMLPVKYGIEFTSKVVYYWGLVVILFGSFTVHLVSNSLFLQILLIPPHLLLFISLRQFYQEPNILSATRCFKFHNIWLGLVFLVLIF